MLPELLKVPGLGISITTYGLLQAVAFLLTVWAATRLAGRDGLSKFKVLYLGICVCPVFLVGTKLLMILTEWQQHGGDWGRMVSSGFLHSVGAYYGGLLAAVAVSPFLARALRLPWRIMVDACAPAIALGGVPA